MTNPANVPEYETKRILMASFSKESHNDTTRAYYLLGINLLRLVTKPCYWHTHPFCNPKQKQYVTRGKYGNVPWSLLMRYNPHEQSEMKFSNRRGAWFIMHIYRSQSNARMNRWNYPTFTTKKCVPSHGNQAI